VAVGAPQGLKGGASKKEEKKEVMDLDERGVEPLAMKIFAGIFLLIVGLGIGYAVYAQVGRGVQSMLSFTVRIEGQTEHSLTLGVPASGENSASLSVRVEEITPYDKMVVLIATGIPENVRCSFSPGSGQPTFGSTLTIRVGPQAPRGTHTITVKAAGEDGTEQTAILSLALI
jgi:hypothetical protein